MASLASSRPRAVLLVVALCVTSAESLAQAASAGAAASPVVQCEKVLAELNAGLGKKQVEALLAAATLLELGRCVARDDAKAAEYLSDAARSGSRPAALRLARKFGRGAGMPQSYANAGAWVTGKGHSDERIEAWDYSIGYAYTVAAELLAVVQYPRPHAGQPSEVSFAVEIDAARPTRLTFRGTSTPAPGSAALLSAVQRAFDARLAEVVKWLPAPDPKWIVMARVTVPVSIRYDSPTSVAALEDDLILR
jgi:hypothetical protein